MRYILAVLVILFLLVDTTVIYGQYSHRSKSGIAKQRRGGKDPFSGSRKKYKVHFDRGLSFSPKQSKKRSKKKKYSLSSSQQNNQRHAHAKKMSKGSAHIRGSVASDAFSRKSKKKYRSSGGRGEEFYKKKHKKRLQHSHRGRETKRMEKANKKSFKKR